MEFQSAGKELGAGRGGRLHAIIRGRIKKQRRSEWVIELRNAMGNSASSMMQMTALYQEYETRREAVKELKVLMAMPEPKDKDAKKKPKKGDDGQKIADDDEEEY